MVKDKPTDLTVGDITQEHIDATASFKDLRVYTLAILQSVQSTNNKLITIEAALRESSDRSTALLAENNTLRQNIDTLQRENNDMRAELANLSGRVVANERSVTANGQYLRRRQLTIVANNGNEILKESRNLKATVAELLSTTGTHVREKDIDKCHILHKDKGVVIMEMYNRTLRDDVLLSRKKLKGKTHESYGNIYINESLSKGMKSLDYICRRLKSKDFKVIHSTWVWNGRLFVKRDVDATKLPIGHINDLIDEFGAEMINRIERR